MCTLCHMLPLLVMMVVQLIVMMPGDLEMSFQTEKGKQTLG